MALPREVQRCDDPQCCCKCKLAFRFTYFPALVNKPPNHDYICSVFADEGLMIVSDSQHGLCEMFTHEH